MDLLASAILIGVILLVLWGLIRLVRGVWKFLISAPTENIQTASENSNEMNDGDYYNGPHGYTPMTGYTETQYGSGFDEDAEWHEEH